MNIQKHEQSAGVWSAVITESCFRTTNWVQSLEVYILRLANYYKKMPRKRNQYYQIFWPPKERTSLLWTVTGSTVCHLCIECPCFYQQATWQQGSCGRKRHLCLWQMLALSLNCCSMCLWCSFVSCVLAYEKAFWTFFQDNSNQLAITLQSLIKLTEMCNYPYITPIFSSFPLILQKTLLVISLKSTCVFSVYINSTYKLVIFSKRKVNWVKNNNVFLGLLITALFSRLL